MSEKYFVEKTNWEVTCPVCKHVFNEHVEGWHEATEYFPIANCKNCGTLFVMNKITGEKVERKRKLSIKKEDTKYLVLQAIINQNNLEKLLAACYACPYVPPKEEDCLTCHICKKIKYLREQLKEHEDVFWKE